MTSNVPTSQFYHSSERIKIKGGDNAPPDTRLVPRLGLLCVVQLRCASAPIPVSTVAFVWPFPSSCGEIQGQRKDVCLSVSEGVDQGTVEWVEALGPRE